MKFTVDTDSFFRLKELQNVCYYVEDEEAVDLFFQREGAWIKATYFRPDYGLLEDDAAEEASQKYLLWKQIHLSEAVRVLSVDEKNVTLRVINDA